MEFRLIILWILISVTLSCSKDVTKTDTLTIDVEFNELGSDGPYVNGET